MSSYCLKCKENTENINPSLSKTNSGKRLLLSKCALCGGKNLAFIKKQEASVILSSLGLKTSLGKISSFGDIFFLNAISLNNFNMRWMK